MTDTTANATSAGPVLGDKVDLLLRSVGTAQPDAVSLLHAALGLPKEWLVDAIYRAPVRLLPDLPREDAEKFAVMLRRLGLEVETAPPGTQPRRGPLFDLALYLTDPARADEVAACLAAFLSVDAAQAFKLIVSPPGLILGNVTQATVDALRASIPADAAELLASQRDTARFALFAPKISAWQHAAIKSILPENSRLAEDGSLTCMELDKQQADRLWRQLAAGGAAQIVNQDFLRFTLFLTAVPADASKAALSLQKMLGMPVDVYPQLIQSLPCPVVEAVTFRDLPQRLEAFAAAGFSVRADLETFALAALDIRQASQAALQVLGVDASAPLMTEPMARELARVRRAQLRRLGAQVYLI